MIKYGLLHITEGIIVLTHTTPEYFERLKLAHKFYKRFNIFPPKWEQELKELESVSKIPLQQLKFGLEFCVVTISS